MHGHTDRRGFINRVAKFAVGGVTAKFSGKTCKGQGQITVVLVIHENRGLNPYVEEVARRVATAGFLALAPKGGYPATDDEGRILQRELDL